MRRLSIGLGLALLVAVGALIWMGITLGQVMQENFDLIVSMNTHQSELEIVRHSSQRAQAEAVYSSNLLNDAERQWEAYASPHPPSAAAWAPLAVATGLRTHETNAHMDSPKAQIDRAIRLLSQTVPLGPAAVPPQEAERLRLEFLGVPDGMVILTQQVAYFRGQAYFRPNLTEWLRTNMVVKS